MGRLNVKKCKVINQAARPVNKNDIINERIAIEILEKRMDKKVLEQLQRFHMWQERYSSFDFQYCIRDKKVAIVDVKTVSNNAFAVGIDKLQIWQNIDAFLKLVVFLDMETKSKITIIDVTNIDISKRRIFTSRFGTSYIDLRYDYPISIQEVNIYIDGGIDYVLAKK